MTDKEIIQALRETSPLLKQKAVFDAAADFIETQQAEIDSLKSAQVTHYCANCEAMARKLAEAERRERAAAKDWGYACQHGTNLDPCIKCTNLGSDDEGKPYCKLRTCRPSWAGPMEESK